MKKFFLFVVLIVSMISVQSTYGQSVSVTTIPSPPTICAGQSITLQANPSGGTAVSYFWVPGGACSPSITVTPLVTTTYTVTVNFICGTVISACVTVTVSPVPLAAGPITGPTTVCQNSMVVFSISTIPGATSYVWSVPPGATIVSGQGTTMITVDFSNACSGNVSVYGQNSCGLGQASFLAVTVNPSNPTVSLVLTPDNFCTDVNSAILTGGSPPGGTYTGTCIFYGNTVYPPVCGVGTYLVTYTYTDGFGYSATATDLLTINPIPAVMFLNVTTGVYTDTPAFCLEPYVSPTGGVFVGPGIIGDYFYPAMAGVGTWMVSYTYTHPLTGCSATQIQYIPVGEPLLGIDNTSIILKNINIFPNPTAGQLNLRGIDAQDIKSIRIMNILGKTEYITEKFTDSIQLDVSEYPAGLYVISFIRADGVSFSKHFVKE